MQLSSFRSVWCVPLVAPILFLSGCRVPGRSSGRDELTPVLSIKELMEHIVDPQADYIFDSVAVEVTDKGMTETRPVTDDDWIRVQRGALELAEASNLLKIPRRAAPAEDGDLAEGGPELAPREIEARIAANRSLWNSHANALRNEALKVLEIVRARDADRLYEAGDRIDRVCESCHLDYWYPGDREAVERNRGSRAYTAPDQTAGPR